jgi:hypothetical protein
VGEWERFLPTGYPKHNYHPFGNPNNQLNDGVSSQQVRGIF